LTAATHYADDAGSSPSTGPVTADANGRLVRWIEEGAYIQTLPGGAELEVQAVSGATVASVESSVAELETSTPTFHVGRFLVFADPVQEAMDAADADGGGEVVVPEATWTRSATLDWKENVKLRGEGPAAVIHYTGSGVAVQFGSGGLDVSTWTRLSCRDIKLTGTSSATAGLKVRGATRFDVDNLTINGFTAGSGILLNGASFIGKIGGGRITNCSVGISCQKQAGDGSDGRGQAGNALEICGQMEIQTCTDAILIGNPTTNETLPVVGMSIHIHDITVEGNTRGIWNVSGYSVKTSKIYYELNVEFDERIGSAGGNTIIPIHHVAEDNFHNLAGTPLAYDIVRGDNCEIERPLIIGLTVTSVTGVAATNELTKVGHSLLDGTTVAFTALNGGAGLATATVYYVRDRTADTFKLAATLGGAEIDFTTDIIATTTITAGRAWQTTAPPLLATRDDRALRRQQHDDVHPGIRSAAHGRARRRLARGQHPGGNQPGSGEAAAEFSRAARRDRCDGGVQQRRHRHDQDRRQRQRRPLRREHRRLDDRQQDPGGGLVGHAARRVSRR
jgi:hypothetical protein